ncbi:MIP-related peptides-like [Ruditapes philippinarum]|uniref:MIP-related peptides-like n=1 Tax=Ruditapes philippinarum TaxID=129788 RepID=UPI00295BED21|nr:MIP-related peptides-like [Ruditapes philippinarum]
MEQVLIILSALTLILTASIGTAENTGAAEGSNAQAISGDSGGSSGSVGGSDKLLLVRRYVPRFVGKRDPEDAEIDNVSVESSEKPDEKELSSIDEYVENLLEYYDDLDLSEFDSENENKDSPSESDIESYETDSEYENDTDENDDILMDSQGEKRYVPSFVGKRFTTLDENEGDFIDESKRYRPMFVGKRYRPMFVGKRYQPRFIGKRYTPRFIGKRYTPRFIGKRYTPRFIGKRYTPRFIGKRYTPRFIGKRYTPRFIGKRYAPRFIGKRLQPIFVGKKFSPEDSLQEKRYKPFFVGKRSQDQISNEQNHVEKRSVSETTEEINTVQENADRSKRRKRSVGNANDESLKRAWGRYIPLKNSLAPAFRLPGPQPSYMEKRFVAPEFIGRRDSLSTILSALDALQFARTEPRTTSKRFEAPLFIGKRTPTRPMFIGKRNQPYTGEMKIPSGYSIIPGITEFNMDAYESIPDEFSPFRDIYPYSTGLQGSIDLE